MGIRTLLLHARSPWQYLLRLQQYQLTKRTSHRLVRTLARTLPSVSWRYKYDLHIHSCYSDGVDTPAAIVAYARQLGLTKIAITDHNTIQGGLVGHALAPDFVIVGAEIMTTGGEILALHINKDIAPYQDVPQTIEQIHQQGGIAIAAHPFDQLRTPLRDPSLLPLFDAVELLNSHTMIMAWPRLSLEQYRWVGSSDAHRLEEIGRAYTLSAQPLAGQGLPNPLLPAGGNIGYPQFVGLQAAKFCHHNRYCKCAWYPTWRENWIAHLLRPPSYSAWQKLNLLRKLVRLPATAPQISLILIGYLSSGGRDLLELGLALLALGPLLYGGIYIFNDLVDYRVDRHNPAKQKRPIAAGQISLKHAALLGLVLLLTGLALSWGLDTHLGLIATIILLNNLAYSFYPRWKDIPYMDLCSNAGNYALRYLAGALLANPQTTWWWCALVVWGTMVLNFLCLRLREYTTEGAHIRKVFAYWKPSQIKGSYYTAELLLAFILFYTWRYHQPHGWLVGLYSAWLAIFFQIKFFLAGRGIHFDHMVNPRWAWQQHKPYVLVSLMYYGEFLLMLALFSSCQGTL